MGKTFHRFLDSVLLVVIAVCLYVIANVQVDPGEKSPQEQQLTAVIDRVGQNQQAGTDRTDVAEAEVAAR